MQSNNPLRQGYATEQAYQQISQNYVQSEGQTLGHTIPQPLFGNAKPVPTTSEKLAKCLPGHSGPIATVTFRPLEGRFNKDKDIIGKMDPYCKFKIGWHSGKSSVAKGEGTHPTWSDLIVLERKHGEKYAKLKVKDKDRLRLDDRLGEVKIDLDEIAVLGKVTKWYNLYQKDKITGEILLDIEYAPHLM